jgi:hypothetical protein
MRKSDCGKFTKDSGMRFHAFRPTTCYCMIAPQI